MQGPCFLQSRSAPDKPCAVNVLNLCAYRFVALDDLSAMRTRLADEAAEARVLGTVLLAPEGINLFLAGPAESLRGLIATWRREPAFAGLQAKESWSDAMPFRRLRVKIKREIIRMDQPTVRPEAGRAPAVTAATLARWLDAGHDDAGRPLLMLDTRNGFEVEAGRFAGAIDWRLERFGDFPAALAAHRQALTGKTVVSYCTGGIRCEKTALWMREQGIADVFQLEGGILGYLEAVGPRHFEGSCFVFDDRIALDGALRPAAPAGVAAP